MASCDCYTPQKIYYKDYRRFLLNLFFFLFFFFHWLPSGFLYLPVNEGGQGLIELSAKVKAMRLKSAQRLLFSMEFIPWLSFGLAVLRSFCGVELDKQLFLMSFFK